MHLFEKGFQSALQLSWKVEEALIEFIIIK